VRRWVRGRATLIPIGVLLALPPTGGISGAAQIIAERPNVLVIMTDDQRADTLGVMKRTQRWFFSEGASSLTRSPPPRCAVLPEPPS
jgi:hypothetical protein